MQTPVGQKIAETVTYSGAATATGSGLWGWLGENASQISAIGVLVGVCIGLMGLYYQYKRSLK